MSVALRIGLALSILTLVGGCDTWLGDQGDPPLPGDRISVLVHERDLVPDPKLVDAEIVLPPPSPTPDWPQAGGYANHAMHHLLVGEDLKRAWRADIGSGADDTDRLISSPIVAEGRIYTVDTETEVSAFDATSGRNLWRVELTPEDEDDGHIAGGLAYENGHVYVATGFAQVVALDAATGAEVWRKKLKGPIRSAPTARGGRLFVITVDNRLTALNGKTGEVLWDHAGITEVASLLGGGSPAVDAGVVVAPYSSGELVALKAENGRVLWTNSLASVKRTDVVSTLSHIRGRPVIDRGRVFAVSHGGLMAAIDLRSGRRIWEKEIGGIESPWVAGDYLFTLTNNAEVICMSRKDGRIFWVSNLQRYEDEEDREDPIIWSGPILASDRLIVAGSHGEAVTISPYTGRLLGAEELPSGVNVAPIVAGEFVYLLSENATLSAYR